MPEDKSTLKEEQERKAREERELLNRLGSNILTKVLELAKARNKEEGPIILHEGERPKHSPSSSIDSLDLAVLLMFYLDRIEFWLLKLIRGRFVKALWISMLAGFITWTILNVLHLLLFGL